MKHSNTFERINELDRIEWLELAKAVEAHGGEYKFGDQDMPVVLGQLEGSESTMNLHVARVTASNGIINVYDDNDEPIEYLESGHVGMITNCIPATPEVTEVCAPLIELWVVFGKPMARLAHNEVWDEIKEFVDKNKGLDWSWKHETFLTSVEGKAYVRGLFAGGCDDAIEILDPRIEAHRLLIEYCKSEENE